MSWRHHVQRYSLQHWGRNKVDAISRRYIEIDFVEWIFFKFQIRFHWNLLLWGLIKNIPSLVQIIWNHWWLAYYMRHSTSMCYIKSADFLHNFCSIWRYGISLMINQHLDNGLLTNDDKASPIITQKLSTHICVTRARLITTISQENTFIE